MIEGIKVTIGGQELVKLAQDHATALVKKAAILTGKLGVIDEVSSAGKSFNPADEARQKIKRYEADAAELVFIADHLELNETYLLGRSDLAQLGIIKSAYS